MSERVPAYPVAIKSSRTSQLWAYGALLGLACAFTPNVPWFDAVPKAFTPLGLSGHAATAAQRLYVLLKSAILWAPVGFLLTLAGIRAPLILSIAGAYVLVFLSVLFAGETAWQASALIELAACPPGLWLGQWLVRGFGQAASAPTTSASSATLKPADATATGNQARSPESHKSTRSRELGWRSGSLPLRVLGAVGVITTGFALADLPQFGPFLVAVGMAYVGALYVLPLLWLFVLPLALPVLDLAFWTGHFYFDEFDCLVLLTLSGRWLWARYPITDLSPRVPWALLGAFVTSALISGLIGTFPLAPINANAFANYWSPFNALRIAKGIVEGILVYAWIRPLLGTPRLRWLYAGLSAGVALTALIALREYWLFGTSGASASDYRATAMFSSMHTGGSHIETFLVFALAFVIAQWRSATRWWLKAFALVAFGLTLAAIITTVARGGILGALAVIGVFAVSALRHARLKGSLTGNSAALTVSAALLGMCVLVVGVLGNPFFRERFAQTAQDVGVRVTHWRQSLAMSSAGPGDVLLGQGLGAYPRTYLLSATEPLGTYSFENVGGESFLRLGAGGTLYMAQRITLVPHRDYRLRLSTRTADPAQSLEISICEKSLFNSHQCEWRGVQTKADTAWTTHELLITSNQLGTGPWWARRPLQVSLLNSAARTLIDIDNLELLDSTGKNVIRNGDFATGGDYWFFNSGNHLAWHAKNLWVHTYVEQGLLGVLTLSALMLATGIRLLRRVWRGDQYATPWLAALGGVLTIAVVDSVLDAPRLALLLVLTLLVGASKPRRRVSRHQKRR